MELDTVDLFGKVCSLGRPSIEIGRAIEVDIVREEDERREGEMRM